MHKLLDNLDSRRGLDNPSPMLKQELPARCSQFVLGANGIDQYRRIDDDVHWARWASSNSARNSPGSLGTDIGSAARIRAIATSLLSALTGRESITSQITTTTDTLRARARSAT